MIRHVFDILKVLIDTWWNVNKRIYLLIKKSYSVLIDTWWNVNEDYLDVLGNIESVLIDTWWNVNVFNTIEDTGLYVF